MLSLKKLSKICVLISVVLLIGFQRVFGFLQYVEHQSLYYRFFGILAVMLAVVVQLLTRDHPEIRKYFKTASEYLIVFSIIITISMIYTARTYSYSVREILDVLSPYLLIFYCYPVIYIFYRDGETETFSRTISRIVLLILAVKAICWLLYTFKEIELFPDLLFEYQGWIRNDRIRMDAGFLYGFAFAFYISLALKTHKMTYSKFALIFMALFMIFITRFRFQMIALVLTFLVTFIFSIDTQTKYRNRVIIIALASVIFIASGALDKIIDSFSVTSELGGSTTTRILTAAHYWHLMLERKAVIGLGLLTTANDNAFAIMKFINIYDLVDQYYLEDLGIIGAFFKFGILIVPLYGTLFYKGIKSCISAVRSRIEGYTFVVAVVSYMIISCLALDIFDFQRSLNMPFYLAVISYFSEKARLKEDGLEELQEKFQFQLQK